LAKRRNPRSARIAVRVSSSADHSRIEAVAPRLTAVMVALAGSPRVVIVVARIIARDRTARGVKPDHPAAASKHNRMIARKKQVRLKSLHSPRPAVMPRRNSARTAARKAVAAVVAVVADAAVQDKTAIQAVKEKPRAM
jgi:hypothetical protein